MNLTALVLLCNCSLVRDFVAVSNGPICIILPMYHMEVLACIFQIPDLINWHYSFFMVLGTVFTP